MTEGWARRHRQAHEAHKRGKKIKLEPHVTRRYAAEFEAALRARGAAAKEAAKRDR